MNRNLCEVVVLTISITGMLAACGERNTKTGATIHDSNVSDCFNETYRNGYGIPRDSAIELCKPDGRHDHGPRSSPNPQPTPSPNPQPDSCNQAQLNVCLQNGGGNACYPKWGCVRP